MTVAPMAAAIRGRAPRGQTAGEGRPRRMRGQAGRGSEARGGVYGRHGRTPFGGDNVTGDRRRGISRRGAEARRREEKLARRAGRRASGQGAGRDEKQPPGGRVVAIRGAFQRTMVVQARSAHEEKNMRMASTDAATGGALERRRSAVADTWGPGPICKAGRGSDSLARPGLVMMIDPVVSSSQAEHLFGCDDQLFVAALRAHRKGACAAEIRLGLIVRQADLGGRVVL